MKQLTNAQMAEQVTVTCYGRKETMTREQAIDKYFDGMQCCEGSERDRYVAIYCQLMEGLTEVSDEE
jgi:hypothetical protein